MATGGSEEFGKNAPPITDGALPGVLRAKFLAVGGWVEAELTLDDLRTTTCLMLGSSLHGLRPARVSEFGADGYKDILISILTQ
jgi:branched-subunit amino acid aminotransferase/4-amino-4-deoxychorismate lyase